tara:strand:- start:809 stop:1174 length:366 start_codon:yes stop_codon:yes gene_type:complete
MSLTKVLNEYYGGQWSTFPCPSDTIDDYDNIIWVNEIIPTREEINAKIAELKAAEPFKLLREERNHRLVKTDWRATIDYPGTDQEAWLTYRQALRDLPATSEPELDEQKNLVNVTWPTKPE